MKKYLVGALLTLAIVIPLATQAQNATQPMLNAWRVVSGYILPNNSANGLRVPALGSTGNPCLSVGTTGIFATTTCGSGGAGATTTINGFSGPAFTFATSSVPGLNFLITGSGSTITFAPAYGTGYSIPLNASSTEWSTAYGWGNHASAGYLTASALTPYLTTTTAASTYEPILTKGNLTATSPLQFDNTRQVIGGAAAVSVASGYTIPTTTLLNSLSALDANVLSKLALSTSTGGSTFYVSTSTNSIVFNWPANLLTTTTAASLYQPIGSYLTGVAWGDITGTLSNQTDLQTALNAKLSTTTASTTYQPLDTDLTTIAGFGHATGTLIGSTASAWQVQNAGTAGQFLRSSSTSATGLDWASAGGSGTVTSVDMTVPTGLTVSGNPVTTSGTLAVALAAGYVIPLSASTTNWNNFYDTPSGRITAGTNLAWSGNTLNGNMASSTIIAGGTATHSPSVTFATSSDTNLLLSIVCATATCTFNPTWTGTLADDRIASAATWNAKQAGDATLTALAGLTVAQGDLIYGTGADAFSMLAKDTNATRYLSNTGSSNNPAWAQVALGTGVSGVLPIANGGTATTSSPTVIGQLLAAHSSGGWGVTNLVAGANITLTTSTPGQITIAGAAGGSGNSAWTIGSGLIYNATSTDEIGIGTSTPDYTLTIQGNGATNPFRIASSTGTNLITVGSNGSTTLSSLAVAGFVRSTSAGSLYVDTASYVQDGCTDCLNATEIEDIYLLIAGDSSAGNFTWTGTHSFSASTTMASTSITGALNVIGNIAGTNLSGTNTGDVTLAGENYITISNQQITAAKIALGSQVSGVLPIANGGTATTTSPTNIGQLLASHASGSWGVTTLINGAGITVTTSTAGSLTIASTLGTAIDISAETNLTAGDGLTLTDDDLDCDTATGAIFGCLAAADWLTFNNKLSGSLTSGYIVKASGASTTANSILFELSGKLGVNTTTPIQTLNVVGSAGINPFAVSSSTGATLFSINTFGTTTISNLVSCDTIDTDSSGNLKCGADATGASSGNAAWTILSGVIHNATSTDEVGIGTTTPDYTLTIQGNGSTNYFRIASSTGDNVLAVENTPTPGLSIGTSSVASTLILQGHSTAPTSNLIVAASSSGASMLTLGPTGNLTVAGSFTAASITNILDDLGQTNLADPGADQIVFWDDSDTHFDFLSTLTGLAISGNTLTVNDVTCTDCLNATEIEDIYLLLAGDTSSGNYTWSGTHAFNASTTMASTTITGAANIIGNLNISGGLTLGTDLAVADGGSGAGTFTDHGVLVGSGTDAFTALGVGTNGQLLVGSTGADPVFATANCGANLTCTLGAGTFQIDVDATLAGLTGITSTGAIDFGGAVLEISNGTAPTADDVGELAHDTTDNQLILDDYVMARAVDKLWSVTVASTSVAFISGGLMPVPTELDGYTITAIRCKVDSGTSKVIAIEDASANSTEDITCATTVTSDDGSITNGTATAAEEMYIDFGATTGSVDYVTISVFGTLTRE